MPNNATVYVLPIAVPPLIEGQAYDVPPERKQHYWGCWRRMSADKYLSAAVRDHPRPIFFDRLVPGCYNTLTIDAMRLALRQRNVG